MGENLGFLLRVKYVKRGRLAFLSHLETIRSMERIIRRAQLPYAITEGFNPHMKVSFGPALPCGAAGEGEYLDLRMREYVKPAECLERMQRASVADLTPIACEYIDVRADAVTVAFPISDWRATFSGGTLQELQTAFTALSERGYIEILRKNKKRKRGPMELKRIELEGRLLGQPQLVEEDGVVALSFSTVAQQQGASLRPDRYIEAALEFIPEAERPAIATLARTALRGE